MPNPDLGTLIKRLEALELRCDRIRENATSIEKIRQFVVEQKEIVQRVHLDVTSIQSALNAAVDSINSLSRRIADIENERRAK